MGVEELDLRESTEVDLQEGVGEDGTVLMHVIRPGLGHGKGRHLYEADMLEANASKFVGWKMFVDHQSSEAKKAAGGLPRSIRDLGGRIVESWWDPSIPGDDRHGAGAVVARAKPTPFVRDLIENDPEIVEASISATATSVKPVNHGGQRAWLVEGIEDRGSVDWVTEAGAGGRVVSLMEAAYTDASDQVELLEALTDEEFEEYLLEQRPYLIEGIADGDDGEAVTEGDEVVPDVSNQGDDMGEITPELLSEALQSPELQDHLGAVIDRVVEVRVEEVLAERGQALVEGVLANERDLIRAESRADAERQMQLRDLRDTAHQAITESKLPESWRDDLRAEYTLTESGPSAGLDVVDEVDDEGNTVKTADAVLREAVDERIKRARTLLAAANPARVVRQGPSADEDGDKTPASPMKGGLAADLLQEAGFEDPDAIWADGDKALTS